MKPLTAKQAAVLEYLRTHNAPTYDEIGAAVGISTPHTWRIIRALQAQGHVSLAAGKQRAIRLSGMVESDPDPDKMTQALRAIRIKCESWPVTTNEIIAICDGALA